MNFKKNKKGLTPIPKCSAGRCEKGWRQIRRVNSPDIRGTKLQARGFTFVELIIAIFIFSLMMIALAGIFSSSFGEYRNVRIMQKDLEDSQFVMNQMAKTLRASSIVSSAGNSRLIIYDYSQNRCLGYQFVSGEIRTDAAVNTVPLNEDPIVWCSANFSPNFSTEKKMAAFFVEGRFFPISSNNAAGSEKLGKITIAMKICSNSNCSGDEVVIQTSVSLRDYAKAGI